jgi:hypothetical protein
MHAKTAGSANDMGSKVTSGMEIFSLSAADAVSFWANIAFILSLVVGVIAAVLIYMSSNVKEHHFKREMAAASERIAQLGKETAEANARTQEAQERTENIRLLLELQNEPRDFRVNREKFVEILKDEPPLAAEFRYDPNVPDSYNLAFVLAALLHQIGWETDLNFEPVTRTHLSPLGIEIRGGSGTEEVLDTLTQAILKSGASSSTSTGVNSQFRPGNPVADKTVRITVWERSPSWIGSPMDGAQDNKYKVTTDP